MNLLSKALNKIFKSGNQQELDKIKPIVDQINSHEIATAALKNDEFKEKTYLLRKNIKEGRSLIFTLMKSLSNEENRFKRINVQKITSLQDLLNKHINEVTFNLKSLKELDEISKILPDKGNTLIKINLSDNKNYLCFHLEKKRNIERKTINLLRNKEISAIIG